MLPNASHRDISAQSCTVGDLSYMENGAIHWRPITRRKWQIQAYNPQLVRNSSSPKALGLAEVVYFVERHLKCRHSNREDLKEQWSNHKGSPPWGTKDNMGAYQNTVKWFLPLLVFPCLRPCFFFFSWSVKSLISPKDNLYYTLTQALLCSGAVKSWASNFEPPNNEIYIYICSQSGWAHLSPWVQVMYGLCYTSSTFPLSQENTTEICESFTLRLHRTLPLSKQLDHCGCQESWSTASHFFWWWWWGRQAAGQGPGGFVIYLVVSFLCFFCLVVLVGEAELPGGYKEVKCSGVGLAVYLVLWDTLTSAVVTYKRSTFWLMPLLWAAVKNMLLSRRVSVPEKKKGTNILKATKHRAWHQVQRESNLDSVQKKWKWICLPQGRTPTVVLFITQQIRHGELMQWFASSGHSPNCEGVLSQVESTARAKTSPEQPLKARSSWGEAGQSTADLRHLLFLRTSSDF